MACNNKYNSLERVCKLAILFAKDEFTTVYVYENNLGTYGFTTNTDKMQYVKVIRIYDRNGMLQEFR